MINKQQAEQIEELRNALVNFMGKHSTNSLTVPDFEQANKAIKDSLQSK
ncbi:MAG: hypothetical protein ABI972_11330 [Acidobacteriota bacterium]